MLSWSWQPCRVHNPAVDHPQTGFPMWQLPKLDPMEPFWASLTVSLELGGLWCCLQVDRTSLETDSKLSATSLAFHTLGMLDWEGNFLLSGLQIQAIIPCTIGYFALVFFLIKNHNCIFITEATCVWWNTDKKIEKKESLHSLITQTHPLWMLCSHWFSHLSLSVFINSSFFKKWLRQLQFLVTLFFI